MSLRPILSDVRVPTVATWPGSRRFAVPHDRESLTVGDLCADLGAEVRTIPHDVGDRLEDDFEPSLLRGLDHELLGAADLRSVVLFRSRDGTLTVVDTWSVPGERVWTTGVDVACDGSGRFLILCGGDTVSRLLPGGTTVDRSLENRRFCCLGTPEDGAILATGRDDGQVEIRDPETLEVRRVFPAFESPTLALAVHPNGSRVAVSSDRAGLRVLDTETGQDVVPLSAWSKVVGLHWLPEGRLLAVHLSRFLTIHEEGREVHRVAFPELETAYIQGSAVLGRGEGVLLACEDRGLFLHPLP